MIVSPNNTQFLAEPPGGHVTEAAVVGNFTSAPVQRDAGLARVEIAVQCTILTLALGGNIIVLAVLLGVRRKRKLSRMNLMILHLSCADLFVAFFNTLPQLAWEITHRFYGGDFLCRFIKLFQVVAMFASSYVLVTTAVDRFLAIVYPLSTHYWTKTRMLMLVGVAWGLSLVFSVPQVFIFKYVEVSPGHHDCWAHFNPPEAMSWYITYMTVLIYIIPFFCLVTAYGCICYVVWNSMRFKEKTTNIVLDRRQAKSTRLQVSNHRNGANRNLRSHVRGGLTKAKVRTVKLTLSVILSYLFCWGPFFIAQMWAAWDKNAPFQGTTMVIIMLLPSLNSCTNPWIYLGFSSNLHRQATRCWFRRARPSSTAPGSVCLETPSMRSTTVSNSEFTRVESTNFL